MNIKKVVCITIGILGTELYGIDKSINPEIIQIEPDSLQEDLNTKDGILMINVLNRNTFKDCSIKGSVHVSVDHLQGYARKMLRKGKWTLEKEIVIYCASADCPLSNYACKLLKSLGFWNVKLLKGGMRDWKQKGYPCRGKGRAGYLRG